MPDLHGFFDIRLLKRMLDNFVDTSRLHGEYSDVHGECFLCANMRAIPVSSRFWRSTDEGQKTWPETIANAMHTIEDDAKPAIFTCGPFQGAVMPVFAHAASPERLLGAICCTAERYVPKERLTAGAALLSGIAASTLVKQVKSDETYRPFDDYTPDIRIREHFLFNMLTTIQGQALIEKAPNTAAIIADLAAYLRRSVRKHKQTASLQEEFALIDAYLSLEVRRYQHRLKWELSLPAEIQNIMIPTLLLLPLVENAIKHAVEPKLDGTALVIKAAQLNNETLLIEVADDGDGMEVARVAALLDEPERGDLIERQGIAMVRQRLRQFYGEKAHLIIDSRPHWGFWLQLVLPLKL